MNSEWLSSDVLERQFGPTRLDVLYQRADTRVIQTFHDDQVLELSLVKFDEKGAAEFLAIHEQILAGASMGQAFRRQNVPFERRSTGRDAHRCAEAANELVCDERRYLGCEGVYFCWS